MSSPRAVARLLLTLSSAFLVLLGTNVGTANADVQGRAVSGFNAVTFAAVGTLNIRVTGEESLTIEAEPHVLPLLTSDVVGGRLILGSRPTPWLVVRQPIVYNLTVKSLDSLEVTSAGNVNIEGLRAGTLAAKITGTGTVTPIGTADHLDLTFTGTGNFAGENLQTRTAQVMLTGVGNVTTAVSEHLDANLTGTGRITYLGNPSVSKNITGVGTVVAG
ncbi:GIN domain-containing protein [Skermania piniformis]|uniref:DUF2807 domain-containing protein n=1 Tax=Skermania pinensis TaxID=39122 RepID=A0ABX8SCH5_9ACTN|nr:DUF2807 domain-containing protein [Skermania piniformis]QXQ14300.1 DUF2807 domain-containing protein [Skermania piniformis]